MEEGLDNDVDKNKIHIGQIKKILTKIVKYINGKKILVENVPINLYTFVTPAVITMQ